MTSDEALEAQLRAYGRGVAARDRREHLERTPDPVEDRPGPWDGHLDGLEVPYVSPPPDNPGPGPRHRLLFAAAAAAIIIAGGAALILPRRHQTPTADVVDTTTTDPAATTATTAGPYVAATGGPYALPPADATQVHALVDGDFYALRYTSGGHEFGSCAPSNGPPYFRMEPQHLLGLLDGRGQRSDLAPLGTVYVTCGDGGQLANDDPQWIWSSSAVGYWLQDGRYMSLGLTTDTPLQVSFDGETGAARGPDGGPYGVSRSRRRGDPPTAARSDPHRRSRAARRRPRRRPAHNREPRPGHPAAWVTSAPAGAAQGHRSMWRCCGPGVREPRLGRHVAPEGTPP